MAENFTPYWLIHEPGKEVGFAIVRDLDIAITPEAAIAAWLASDEVADWLRAGVDYSKIECEATLITEPFYP